MSYSQIFRRMNRILKSKAQDVIDSLTKEERDLFDFDEELRRHTRQQRESSSASGTGQQRESSTAGAGRQRESPGASGTGQESAHRQSSQRQSSQQQRHARPSGTRKPGERDDAYYLSILGLASDAGVDDVRRAYRRLMATCHPDRVATLDAGRQRAATEKAKVITEAYAILQRRWAFR